MASATARPQRRLWEFLNEQQEPFILEVYLSEREYSKRWSLNGDSGKSSEKSTSSGLNKRRKAMLPFSKVLTPLYNKLGFKTFNKGRIILTREYDKRNKHVSVPEAYWVDDIVQFSSAESSAVFNSCSDIDEEGTSILSHKDYPWFASETCQISSVCNIGTTRQRQRCMEGSLVSLGKIPLCRFPHVNEDVRKMEQRIWRCEEKNTEDSVLSDAVWSLLGQSTKKEKCTMESREFLLGAYVSRILKSKWVLNKIKKLLFDCERDITITIPTNNTRKQGYQQFMGPRELKKLISGRTKEWGQQAGNIAKVTNLLTLDYMNSITEWRNFEPQLKDISVEISNAILERINNEIVSDMIETLAHQPYRNS